jgi:hypothetical protein
MTRTAKYSETLRAIGRDLETKDIQTFILTKSGNEYLIQVESDEGPIMERTPPQVSEPSIDTGRCFQSKCRSELPQNETSRLSTSVDLQRIRYTPDDIEQLGEKGRATRGTTSRLPDFLSLSQILRAIGAMLDLRGDQLLILSRPLRSGTMEYVTLCFKTEQGEIKEHEYLFRDLYDLNVRMYKQRNMTNGVAVKRSLTSRSPWPARV